MCRIVAFCCFLVRSIDFYFWRLGWLTYMVLSVAFVCFNLLVCLFLYLICWLTPVAYFVLIGFIRFGLVGLVCLVGMVSHFWLLDVYLFGLLSGLVNFVGSSDLLWWCLFCLFVRSGLFDQLLLVWRVGLVGRFLFC